MLQIAFWGRGFRPFFFCGALVAIIPMFFWVLALQGHEVSPEISAFWHAHEMIFGFTVAIIAGFLLTAVANWTGRAPIRHGHLVALVVLWLVGRIGMLWPEMHINLMILLESLFLPALAISLAMQLWKSQNWRNLLFIGLLTILWLCDMASLVTGETRFLHIAVLVVMTLISTIGGRIIPAFTAGTLKLRGINALQSHLPNMDKLALVLCLAGGLGYWLLGGQSILTGALLVGAGLVNIYRLTQYHFIQSFADPMLWILQVGFLWMSAGLILIGLSACGLVPLTIALHAMTAGAIGTMCIGMMCRVALGHSGRLIVANKLIVAMFLLMQGAAVLRVTGLVVMPDAHQSLLVVSGMLWSTVFALYLWSFAPILMSARPDGREA